MGLLLIFILPAATWAFPAIPTKEIAPGVHMPWVSIGTGTADKTGDDKNATIIVHNWLTNGGRGIDTAWSYFDQKDVAKGIAASGVDRKDIFITSKVLMCMPKAAVVAQINSDLKALNTDYIDLMLVHTPAGILNWCASTWEVLEEMVEAGTFKAIGISNFFRNDIEKLMKTAKVKPAVNEVQYNVFYHNDDTEAAARENNIPIHSFCPFTDFKMTIPEHQTVFSDPTVKQVAAKYNVSAAQVAARWIYQRGNTFVFLSSNPVHQANSADFMEFTLADEDMKTLNGLKQGPGPGPWCPGTNILV
jgi:diketogulonate reductase-like aldo/keto reductase